MQESLVDATSIICIEYHAHEFEKSSKREFCNDTAIWLPLTMLMPRVMLVYLGLTYVGYVVSFI